jgi:nucleotide-binding universal stress UspA family protein
MQIQKLVCATDFSACSERALGYAALIASLFSAELHLLHGLVLHEDDVHNPEHHFPDHDELDRKMADLLSLGMDGVLSDPGFDPATVLCVQRRGISASALILDYAMEIDADLVVIGTHGRRGTFRWLLGSVADKVIRWATCPVLTVPEARLPRAAGSVLRILTPVDFSPLSRYAVATSRELAATFKADLVLLHVVELPSYPGFYETYFLNDMKGIERQSVAELETLATELELEDRTLEIRFGRPAEEIWASCQARECDLIVMGNCGLSGFRMGGLGTTAENVVRGARCPTLTVRAPESVVLGKESRPLYTDKSEGGEPLSAP